MRHPRPLMARFAERVDPAPLVPAHEADLDAMRDRFRVRRAITGQPTTPEPVSLKPAAAIKYPLIKMKGEDCLKAVCPCCRMPLLGQTFAWDRVRGRLRILGVCIGGSDQDRDAQHATLERVRLGAKADPIRGFVVELDVLMIADDEVIGDAEQPLIAQQSPDWADRLRADFDALLAGIAELQHNELVQPVS